MTTVGEMTFGEVLGKLFNYSPSFDDGGRYVLGTDESSHAVAAILHQEQDGALKVISFASLVLQPTERSYCSIKLELLAAIFGLKTYRHFLLCHG